MLTGTFLQIAVYQFFAFRFIDFRLTDDKNIHTHKHTHKDTYIYTFKQIASKYKITMRQLQSLPEQLINISVHIVHTSYLFLQYNSLFCMSIHITLIMHFM